MRNFRDFKVWEKAHRLTLDSYQATNHFPKGEMFGLTSQIRKAAASIAANIAEGCGKRGNGEFQRFLNIATGSSSVLEYHLLLARDLNLLEETKYQDLNVRAIEVKHVIRIGTQGGI